MTEEELHDLIERVHQIEEMTRNMAWEFLKDRAIVDMAKVQEGILSGKLDHDRYLHETGRYAGMASVLSLPERLRRELDFARAQLEEEREEDEVEA